MKNFEVHSILWDCDGVIWGFKDNEGEILVDYINKARANEDFQNVIEGENKEIFIKQYYDIIFGLGSYFENQQVTMNGFFKYIDEKMPILKICCIQEEEFFRYVKDIAHKLIVSNKDAKEVMGYVEVQMGIKNTIETDFLYDIQCKKLKESEVFEYFYYFF